MGILWIPGILGLTAFPNAKVNNLQTERNAGAQGSFRFGTLSCYGGQSGFLLYGAVSVLAAVICDQRIDESTVRLVGRSRHCVSPFITRQNVWAGLKGR